MTDKVHLRPTTDPSTGEPFQVYVPRKGRTIEPAGEALVVDAFLERRILSGELERYTPAELVREPTQEPRASRSSRIRGDGADTTHPSTGD